MRSPSTPSATALARKNLTAHLTSSIMAGNTNRSPPGVRRWRPCRPSSTRRRERISSADAARPVLWRGLEVELELRFTAGAVSQVRVEQVGTQRAAWSALLRVRGLRRQSKRRSRFEGGRGQQAGQRRQGWLGRRCCAGRCLEQRPQGGKSTGAEDKRGSREQPPTRDPTQRAPHPVCAHFPVHAARASPAAPPHSTATHISAWL